MLSLTELQETEQLAQTYGHREAARRLGIHPKTIWSRLVQLKLKQDVPGEEKPIVNFAHVQNTTPEACVALIDGILAGRIDYASIPKEELE